MYLDKSKYSRENNYFDFKLYVFNDLCSRADILKEVKSRAYSTILQGLALDYYYSSIIKGIKTFSLLFYQMYNLTRSYFKGAKYKRGVLNKQNTTTLKSVI